MCMIKFTPYLQKSAKQVGVETRGSYDLEGYVHNSARDVM